MSQVLIALIWILVFYMFKKKKKKKNFISIICLFCCSSIRIFGMRCSRCKAILRPDEIIMKTSGQVFHLQCFRCSLCDDHLHKGDPYMFRDGLLLCHADFQHHQQTQQQIHCITSSTTYNSM